MVYNRTILNLLFIKGEKMKSLMVYSLVDKNIFECIVCSNEEKEKAREKIVERLNAKENDKQFIIVHFDDDWRNYDIDFLEFLIESSVADLELSYLKEEQI